MGQSHIYSNVLLTMRANNDSHYFIHAESSGATLIWYISSGGTYSTSDIRRKINIETIENALKKIVQVRGVLFNWKKDPNNSVKTIGVIAQEMETVFPSIVDHNMISNTKAVNYGLISPILIQAIKEL